MPNSSVLITFFFLFPSCLFPTFSHLLPAFFHPLPSFLPFFLLPSALPHSLSSSLMPVFSLSLPSLPLPPPSSHTPSTPLSHHHPPKLSGGCELTVVLQDFSAGHSSELSIQVGQTVELLERPSERPGWCLVRTTERSPPQEGLVPSSTLCISHSRSSVEMDCFFPLVKGRMDGGEGGQRRPSASEQASESTLVELDFSEI